MSSDFEERLEHELQVHERMIRRSQQLEEEADFYRPSGSLGVSSPNISIIQHAGNANSLFADSVLKEYYRVLYAGHRALALIELAEESPDLAPDLLTRAEELFEVFLMRAFALHDKSFQVWNTWYGQHLGFDQLTTANIQDLFERHGGEDKFYRRLKRIFNKGPFGSARGRRNTLTHHYSLDAVGLGVQWLEWTPTDDGRRMGMGGPGLGQIEAAKMSKIITGCVGVLSNAVEEIHKTLLSGERPVQSLENRGATDAEA